MSLLKNIGRSKTKTESITCGYFYSIRETTNKYLFVVFDQFISRNIYMCNVNRKISLSLPVIRGVSRRLSRRRRRLENLQNFQSSAAAGQPTGLHLYLWYIYIHVKVEGMIILRD
jgi:hypothetical protein